MRYFIFAMLCSVMIINAMGCAPTVKGMTIQPQPVEQQKIRLMWKEPSTGGLVDEYVLEISRNGRPFTEWGVVSNNRISIAIRIGDKYLARVAARNAAGQGPWSKVSDVIRVGGHVAPIQIRVLPEKH